MEISNRKDMKGQKISKTTGGIMLFLLKDKKYNVEFYSKIQEICKNFGKKLKKDI